jgi:hypothetical protein
MHALKSFTFLLDPFGVLDIQVLSFLSFVPYYQRVLVLEPPPLLMPLGKLLTLCKSLCPALNQ